jgi:PAS domain S-box-containing protein
MITKQPDPVNYNTDVTDILERITDGFYALNNDWQITYWNREAEQMLGKTRQEVLGRTIWESFPDAVHLNFYGLYHKALTEQKPVYFEGYYPPRNIWAEMSIYPSTNGLSVFFKNITARKETEEELHKLSVIVTRSTNAVLILNMDKQISWVNEAFSTITGFSFEEALGNRPAQLITGPDTDMDMIEELHKSWDDGKMFTCETVFYHKSGKKNYLDLSCQPIIDLDGTVKQFFIIMKDITEKKKLEDQLNHEKEESRKLITVAAIQAQEHERSQIGKELHDNVNQVLTTVKLYSELCRDGIANSHELLDKSILLLNDSIQEIRSLSNRLSAPSIGKLRLKDSIKDLVETIAATKKLSIRLHTINIGRLNASPELHLSIYRILQEHLTNILKHSSAQSAEVLIKKINNNILITVSDDGKGFDVKKKKKGIGIINMTSRAENLNGTLEIISKPGKGCKLIVNLPVNS